MAQVSYRELDAARKRVERDLVKLAPAKPHGYSVEELALMSTGISIFMGYLVEVFTEKDREFQKMLKELNSYE